jgi:hypothetical protein
MDPVQQVKILIGNCRAARDTLTASANDWIVHVTNMEEGVICLLGEIDKLERQRGALRAKLQTEVEDARKQLDQVHLEVREAKRELERVHKQTAHDKREILELLDDVAAKAVA